MRFGQYKGALQDGAEGQRTHVSEGNRINRERFK